MKVLEGDKSQVDIIQEESADSGEDVVFIQLGSGHQIFNPNNELIFVKRL